MKISKINDTSSLVKAMSDFEVGFGMLPKEVSNLCKISLIKNLSARLGANKVLVKKTEAKLFFEKLEDIKDLADGIKNYSNVVLDLEKMPIINLRVSNDEDILDKTINFLEFSIN